MTAARAGRSVLLASSARVHQRDLARIELPIERRQQPGPRVEMVVDDGLGDARMLGEPPQRQRFGSLIANQPPGDVHELAMPILA